MKCAIAHCGEPRFMDLPICAPHCDPWVESPEHERTFHPPGQAEQPAHYHTAFADYVRRVEAEHRNGSTR